MLTESLTGDLKAQKYLVDATKLEDVLTKLLHNTLQDVFNALKKNKAEIRLKKKFIAALYKTRVGSLYWAFTKWRELPSKKEITKQNSVNIFHLKLEKLLFVLKRYAFDKLNEVLVEAAQVKRDCIKKMILMTTDRTKLAFQTWVRYTRNLKHIEACRTTINMMKILNGGLRNNFLAIISVAEERKAQIKALK